MGLDGESFQYTPSAQILLNSHSADLFPDVFLEEFLPASPAALFLSEPDLCSTFAASNGSVPSP